MPTVGFDSITLKKDANVLTEFFSPESDSHQPTEQQNDRQATEQVDRQEPEDNQQTPQPPKVIKALVGVYPYQQAMRIFLRNIKKSFKKCLVIMKLN